MSADLLDHTPSAEGPRQADSWPDMPRAFVAFCGVCDESWSVSLPADDCDAEWAAALARLHCIEAHAASFLDLRLYLQ